MKKVSIIIPIYNASKYLKECIDSVINQTFKEIEIILINDGSTDSSLAICNSYKKIDNRVKVIDIKHSGVSCARNEGLKASIGEYIMFLDSDDVFSIDYIKKMYNAIDINKCDIVISGFNYFSKKSNRSIEYSNKSKFLNFKLILKDIINTSNFNSISKTIVRKKVIDKNNIKFDVSLNYFEDYKFSYEVLKNSNRIYYLSNCLYNYRIHSNSASQSFSENKITKWYESNIKVLDYIKTDYKEYEELIKNRKYNCMIIRLRTLSKVKGITYLEFKKKAKVILKEFYSVIAKDKINISEIKFDRRVNRIRAKLIYRNYFMTFYLTSKLENFILKLIR